SASCRGRIHSACPADRSADLRGPARIWRSLRGRANGLTLGVCFPKRGSWAFVMKPYSCLFGVLFVSTSLVRAQPLSDIVRLDTSVSGHIHPALCITPKGTLIAVYCHAEYKPHRMTRSIDGGKTWSTPDLFPPTVNTQVYPGSLTALADGRIVHCW